MCGEVLEPVNKTELKNHLTLPCAPLFMGIKWSDLLTLRNHRAAEAVELFCGTDIRARVVCRGAPQQTVLLLFREGGLLHIWISRQKKRQWRCLAAAVSKGEGAGGTHGFAGV